MRCSIVTRPISVENSSHIIDEGEKIVAINIFIPNIIFINLCLFEF